MSDSIILTELAFAIILLTVYILFTGCVSTEMSEGCGLVMSRWCVVMCVCVEVQLLSLGSGCSCRLVLGVHASQLLPDPVVDLHELADAAIDADGLSLAEVSLVVLGRNALLVARLGQPSEGGGRGG